MSMVRIDYLGTCEELGFSTDSYAWWRPFYRWTFSDGEKEYSIATAATRQAGSARRKA